MTRLCALVLLALVVAGCPRLPPQSNCTPHATRCSPSGSPEVCSPTQRWTRASADIDSCAEVGAVCCLAPSAFEGGSPVHACAKPERCLQ